MTEDSGTAPAMTDAALDEIRTRWLAQCGACDAGLPMSCTHPAGDYRNPMSDLLAEVDRLRAKYERPRCRVTLGCYHPPGHTGRCHLLGSVSA